MTVRFDPGQPPGITRTLLEQGDGGVTRRTVLPGGLRVVTEAMPGVRSATIGIWVGVGSRDEDPGCAGASHFLEHLVFKGTHKRSALDISVALDAVGGELNAFTGKEYTCYHARVLDADLPLAIDVLSDMVTGSLLAPEDIEAERDVILEEIAMNEDDPDDVVHNLIASQVWGDSPLGRPVSGDPDSVGRLSQGRVADFYRERYRPSQIVVSVAGSLTHDAVVRRVCEAFAPWLDARASGPAGLRAERGSVGFASGVSLVSRPIEQANLVLATPGLPRGDDRRYAMGVLNAALGGGMSSRLFQEVRERRSLAYSVYTFGTGYADTGMFGVYAGCAPGKIEEVLKVCRDELAEVAEGGLRAEEVERGKGQLRGGVVLALEDPESRMSRLAKADLLHGELTSIDDTLERVEAVTPDDVREVAALLAGTPAVAVVGPFDDGARFH